MAVSEQALQAVYALSVVTAGAVGLVLVRYRDRPGAMPLAGLNLTGAVWGALQLANVTIETFWLSAVLYRAIYVNIAVAVALHAVFALAYTDRERYLRPATYLALSIHPLWILLSAVVDPGGYFFGSLHPDPSQTIGVELEVGAALLVHMTYVYAVMGVVALLFLELAFRSHALYRLQGVLLFVATVLPAIPPLGLLFGVVEADLTPLAFVLTAAVYTVAIANYRLVDLVPMARDRVLDHVDDGVFVVDAERRLIDVNPAGRELLEAADRDGSTVIGQSVESVFGETELLREFESVAATRREARVDVSLGARHFEVTVTPITDDAGREAGWLLIAHDVTTRKRNEQRLERQNERLDQFASLVSHDLRNPLNVADGYLELARSTDDDEAYLAEVESSHERMSAIIDDVLELTREGAEVESPQPVAFAELAERAWDGVDTAGAALETESSATITAAPDRAQRLLENLFRNAVEHGSTSPPSQAREDAVEHGSAGNRNAEGSDDAAGASAGEPSAADAAEDAVEHGSANPGSRTRPTGLEGEPGGASDVVVTVGVDRSPGDGLTLFVEDDGPGIPPEDRDRIFEDGYSTAEDGTGLGLAIVQQIADAHDWSVEVTEGAAGGARFEIDGVRAASGDGSDAVPATTADGDPGRS